MDTKEQKLLESIRTSGMSEEKTKELLFNFVIYQRRGCGWLWPELWELISEAVDSKPIEIQLTLEGFE